MAVDTYQEHIETARASTSVDTFLIESAHAMVSIYERLYELHEKSRPDWVFRGIAGLAALGAASASYFLESDIAAMASVLFALPAARQTVIMKDDHREEQHLTTQFHETAKEARAWRIAAYANQPIPNLPNPNSHIHRRLEQALELI